MSIGERIKRLRKRKGWTQARLAKVTGLSASYISAIEEGRDHPRIKAIAIIASCLEISLQTLLEEKDTEG
ncbi:MAG: helix-turn-helix domain-containing protein [Desulfitobacteriaceae bacterium]